MQGTMIKEHLMRNVGFGPTTSGFGFGSATTGAYTTSPQPM